MRGIAQNWRHEYATDSTPPYMSYVSIHLTIEDRDEYLRGIADDRPWLLPDGEPYDTDLTEKEVEVLRQQPTALSYHHRYWCYGFMGRLS